jgi:hypothetical protein
MKNLRKFTLVTIVSLMISFLITILGTPLFTSSAFAADSALPNTLVIAASNSPDKSLANYVCDGINDQVEINAAIKALKSQIGAVELMEGNYSISTPILVNNNLTLFGQGENTKITLANNSNRNMIENAKNAGVNVSIHDLALDGNIKNQTQGRTGWNNCAIKRTGNNGRYEGLFISNCEGFGIRHGKGDNTIIINNTINNCHASAISLTESFNGEIGNNNILNCAIKRGDAGRDNCIDIYRGGNHIVSGNYIDGGGALSQIGSWYTPDCKYYNNTCLNGKFMGIGPMGDRSEIVGNTVKNSAENAIDTRGGNNNLIQDNTVDTVNGPVRNELSGICLNGNDEICINNTITLAAKQGIASGSSSGNYIADNTIINCGYVGTIGCGILVKNYNKTKMVDSNTIIKHNICYDDQQPSVVRYGLLVLPSLPATQGYVNNLQVIDNDFSGAGIDGIRICNSANVKNAIYQNNLGGLNIKS